MREIVAWWCQTHARSYPHSVTGKMPDGRQLSDAERAHACRPVEVLAPAPIVALEA